MFGLPVAGFWQLLPSHVCPALPRPQDDDFSPHPAVTKSKVGRCTSPLHIQLLRCTIRLQPACPRILQPWSSICGGCAVQYTPPFAPTNVNPSVRSRPITSKLTLTPRLILGSARGSRCAHAAQDPGILWDPAAQDPGVLWDLAAADPVTRCASP